MGEAWDGPRTSDRALGTAAPTQASTPASSPTPSRTPTSGPAVRRDDRRTGPDERVRNAEPARRGKLRRDRPVEPALAVASTYERCNFTSPSLTGLTTTNCTFVECDFTAGRPEPLGAPAVGLRLLHVPLDRPDRRRFEECKLRRLGVRERPIRQHRRSRRRPHLGVAGRRDLSGAGPHPGPLYGADLDRGGPHRRDARRRGPARHRVGGTNFEDADLQGAHLRGLRPAAARLTGARVDLEQAAQLARAFGVVVG